VPETVDSGVVRVDLWVSEDNVVGVELSGRDVLVEVVVRGRVVVVNCKVEETALVVGVEEATAPPAAVMK
jgi:hypothetical protein